MNSKKILDEELTKEEQEDLGRICIMMEYQRMPADERFWTTAWLPIKLPMGVYHLLQKAANLGDDPDGSTRSLANFAGLVFQEGIKYMVAPLLQDQERTVRLLRSYRKINEARRREVH